MTEKQAREKWCPFVRLPVGRNAGAMSTWMVTANRGFDDSGKPQLATCIASECMMWQVKHPRVSREDHSGGKEAILDEAVRTGRVMRREGPDGSMGTWVLDEDGYCGLNYYK